MPAHHTTTKLCSILPHLVVTAVCPVAVDQISETSRRNDGLLFLTRLAHFVSIGLSSRL